MSPYISSNVKEKKSVSVKNFDSAETEALIRRVKDSFDEFLQAAAKDVDDIPVRAFFVKTCACELILWPAAELFHSVHLSVQYPL